MRSVTAPYTVCQTAFGADGSGVEACGTYRDHSGLPGTEAPDTASPLRPCPACESPRASALPQYSRGDWQIVTCSECSLTYLANPVEYVALEEDFAWEKTYVEKKQKTGGSTRLSPLIRKLRQRLRLTHRDQHALFRSVFGDGHVLDIGCGTGEQIRPPMTPYGIELSTALHAQADALMRSHGGYCVKGAGAEAIHEFAPETFDGILMYSYLEHETDLMGVLRGAYRALKSGGAVFVRVPNFGSINRRVVGAGWCGFRYPDHVTYFTLDTLRATCARAGFTTTLVNRLRLPIDDNISVVLHKQGRGA